MAETNRFDLKSYRSWLLEQIEQELDAFDQLTTGMSTEERESWDVFTDVELEDVARALESPSRPQVEGDRLAQSVLERHGLSLDALDAMGQHTARIEALVAWADLLLLKSEAATDTTRSFASRAQVLAQRRAVLGAQTSSGSGAVGVMSIEAIRQQQGLDVGAGKKRLSELFQEHHDDHRQTWKNWDDRVARDYGPVLRTLIDVLGDIPIEQLTLGHVRRFAVHVKDQGKAGGRRPATIDKTLNRFGAVLRWAAKQGMLKDLTAPLSFKSETTSYEAFTAAELRGLFEAEPYRLSAFRRASRFWVPLLAYFTGARLGEITDAKVEQVKQEEGTLGILLSPGGAATGKNKFSRRFVPLHSALIDAGLQPSTFGKKSSASTRTAATGQSPWCKSTRTTSAKGRGSRCAGARRWVCSGGCTAWCTTSRSWPGTI